MRIGLKSCVVLVALVVFALSAGLPSAFANSITLTPGTSTLSVPANLSAFPATGLLSNTGFQSFSSGGLSGTFEARAYLVGTTVDFFYLVTNSSTSDEIYRLDLSSFKGFSTAVSYDTFPTGGVIPSGASVNAGGDTVSFSFLSPEILPAGRSFWVEIDTNANGFTAGNAKVIAGEEDIGSIASLAPSFVPESSTLGLLFCGFAFLITGSRRRSTVKA